MYKRLYSLFLILVLVSSCEKDEVPAVKAPAQTPPAESLRYLALGDSYTIGESVLATKRFPIQLVQELLQSGLDVAPPVVIARTGWTTTNLLNAVASANLSNEFDLVTLLIGVNNQFQGKSIQQYKKEFITLLLKSIALAEGDKENVIVLSIPDYGYTPYGESNQEAISSEIDKFNAVNKQVADSIGVSYFDITPISRNGLSDPSLVASDGLHPSAMMYEQWVDLIEEEARKKIQSP